MGSKILSFDILYEKYKEISENKKIVSFVDNYLNKNCCETYNIYQTQTIFLCSVFSKCFYSEFYEKYNKKVNLEILKFKIEDDEFFRRDKIHDYIETKIKQKKAIKRISYWEDIPLKALFLLFNKGLICLDKYSVNAFLILFGNRFYAWTLNNSKKILEENSFKITQNKKEIINLMFEDGEDIGYILNVIYANTILKYNILPMKEENEKKNLNYICKCSFLRKLSIHAEELDNVKKENVLSAPLFCKELPFPNDYENSNSLLKSRDIYSSLTLNSGLVKFFIDLYLKTKDTKINLRNILPIKGEEDILLCIEKFLPDILYLCFKVYCKQILLFSDCFEIALISFLETIKNVTKVDSFLKHRIVRDIKRNIFLNIKHSRLTVVKYSDLIYYDNVFDENGLYDSFFEEGELTGPEYYTENQLLKERENEAIGFVEQIASCGSNFIKYKYGIEDNKAKTLDEAAKNYGLSKEQARKLETKTLKIFRNPYYSRYLKNFCKDS